MRRLTVANVAFALVLCASSPSAVTAAPIGFQAVTLVSSANDPDLINPWGLSTNASSPFWVGANGTGKSLVYDSNGVRNVNLTITIPGAGSVTGVTFNGGTGFNNDLFLFASEDGTVSGWRGALGTNAEVLQLADPSNSYKGLDVDAIGTDRYALLADFAGATIDVLKGTQGSPDLPNKFVDPALPAGYAPFNVQVLNGAVYVTYALRDPVTGDDTPGAGNGFVDKFDLNGNFLQRLVSGGALDSPWGLAIAPMGFGDLGGALLVGNFGDGHINAYNLTTGALLETLLDENLDPLTISGLWALRFGNGGNGGALGTLYFTAGPDGEAAGELGKLTAVTSGSTTTGNVPEPASLSLLAAGLGALAWARRR